MKAAFRYFTISCILVVIFCTCSTNKKNRPSFALKEKSYEVIQGEYDKYIDYLGIRPCPDSLKSRKSLRESEVDRVPVSLTYLWESDTIRVISDVPLEECYLIFEAEKKDTIDFCYESYSWYYAKASDINTDYSTLERIKFVVYEQSIGRLSVNLSKKEFEKEFKELIPHLKLRKIKRNN